jgi:predicted amidohydrolase YtcJ
MAARLTTYLVVAIVAATLIAGLIVGAQRDDTEGPVDLIVQNARLFTGDPAAALAEAVAIRGNQILRVGSQREINRFRRPQTIVVDADGAAVVPGFNDTHVHFISGGLGLDRIDLTDAATLEDVQTVVRDWATANPDRPWVLGRGWQPAAFGAGAPTRHQLDQAVSDRPALLLSADGHSAWLNSKALGLAGIGARTAAPQGGSIVRDPKKGEPTGVLTDSAIALAWGAIPAPTRDERARALRAAIAEAHRHGVTSVHDVAADADDLAQYDEFRRTGDLLVRVFAGVPFGGATTDSALANLDELRRRYPDDPLFKTGAVRLTIDGAVESQTAVMLEPYGVRPSNAEPLMAPDDLNRTARLLDARGWQLVSDAAGDRAVRMALDAYAHTVRSNAEPTRGRRHRVELPALVDPTDVARLRPLGVVTAVRPSDDRPEPQRITALTESLGLERAAREWTLKSLSPKGGRIVFASDWPSAPLNPMLEIHAAVNQAAPPDMPEDAWLPGERLDLKAALAASTSAAAYASFDEQRKGLLKPGMLADLVVLSADIFSIPPSALATTSVAVTIFDGKIVFRKNAKPLTH